DSECMLIGVTTDDSLFGSVNNVKVQNNSAAGKVVYTAQGPIYRTTEAAAYDVDVNGEKNTGKVESVADAVSLDEGWTLQVQSWQQGKGALADKTSADYNPMDVAKVDMAPIQLDTLKEWSEIEGLENISGRGLYTKTFTLSDKLDGAYLDLGESYDNILEVTVNGKTLPPVDQFNHILDLGSYMTEGENTITVLTGTTLARAVRMAGGNTSNGDALAAYPVQYGLLGGVTVTPYADVKLSSVKPGPDDSSTPDDGSSSSIPDSSNPSGDSSTGGHPNTGEAAPLAVIALALVSAGGLLIFRKRRA
ncbi:MAG: LPXTG cell wall anchor domain-containing protein, partial [Clostridiales bacterium]|nr:LPXTG cell wall anchor domain-containing protein [Clostridiales bacterium]